MNGLKIKQLIEPNFKEGEKVKISPVGDVIGLDGRAYKINGEEIKKNISQNGIDIVLDENHSFGKACGWFDRNSIEIRDDGIYASLEKNELGQELIEKKMYRYLSPVYDVGVDSREVMGIDSVGLVNRPNILKEEINSKKGDEVDEIDELKKELKDSMATIEAKDKELNDMTNKLKEVEEKLEENNKKQREHKIDTAIAAGTLEANAKDFAMALDDEKLEEYLSLHKKDTGDLGERTEIEQNNKGHQSEAAKAVYEQLGLEGDE